MKILRQSVVALLLLLLLASAVYVQKQIPAFTKGGTKVTIRRTLLVLVGIGFGLIGTAYVPGRLQRKRSSFQAARTATCCSPAPTTTTQHSRNRSTFPAPWAATARGGSMSRSGITEAPIWFRGRMAAVRGVDRV